MKITLENDNGCYSIEDKECDGTTTQECLELFERILMAAGFVIDYGSLKIGDEQ